MKALSGWTISVGLVLAATAAHAQGSPQGMSRPGYIAASDFTKPYADGPPPPRVIYGAPAPAYGPAYGYGYRPAPRDYGPENYDAPYGAALLPPREVYAIVRETGFQPL